MAIQLLTSLAALPLLAGAPAAPARALLQQPTPGVWIGISLTDENGLEVSAVHEGSPAQRAGLRVGDRVLAADGNELGSFDELLDELAGRRPGSHLGLLVSREITVQLDPELQKDGRRLLGVFIDQADAGVGVTEAQPDQPALRAGIVSCDVITSVDGIRVHSKEELIDRMGEIGEADSVELGITREVGLELAARPGAELPPEPVPPPRIRRRMEEPPSAPFGVPSASLREELRELAADLRELRAEIAELRKELDQLRRRGGGGAR